MSMMKRLYLASGLIAILAIASSAIALTPRLTSAQGSDFTPTAQTCDAQDEAGDAAEGVTEGADADTVEDECGPQDQAGDSSNADADNVQEPRFNGSVSVDERQDDDLNKTEEAAALASLATITADQASATARAQVPGDIQKVELDNENGSLVYSVEIGGKDVKVDAGTGAVLHIESDGPED